jgi:hypothetical protein
LTFSSGTFTSKANANTLSSQASLSITSNDGSVSFTPSNAGGLTFSSPLVSMIATNNVNIAATSGFTAASPMSLDGRRVELINFALKSTVAPVSFTASDGISLQSSGSVSIAATQALTFTTNGPQADIKLTSDNNQIQITGTTITVVANQNLGPIEGMISTKEYNYHGIEFIAIDGDVTIGASRTGGSIAITSSRGGIQFRTQNEVCFYTTNIGFFGSTPRPLLALSAFSASQQADIVTVVNGGDLCNQVSAGAVQCPAWSRTMQTVLVALINYKLTV